MKQLSALKRILARREDVLDNYDKDEKGEKFLGITIIWTSSLFTGMLEIM